MHESQKNERTRLMREKIAELSKIDPDAQITKEELEEKKKRFWNFDRKAHISFRSNQEIETNNASKQQDTPKPTNVIKKIFAFDSSYYKSFQHQFEKDSPLNIAGGKSELPTPAFSPSKIVEQSKQLSKAQLPKFASNAHQPANFFKILPVKAQATEPQALKPIEKKTESTRLKQSTEVVIPKNIQQSSSNDKMLENKEIKIKPIFDNKEITEQANEFLSSESATQPKKINLFGNAQVASTPISLFGNNKGTSLFSLGQNKNQSAQQNPPSLFNLGQNQPQATEQKPKPLFTLGQSNIPSTGQQKEEAPKLAPIQIKPLFSFPSIVKAETQQMTPSQRPEQKRSFSQTFGDKLEKKQSGIKSIFDTSNNNALNLNPAKPVSDAPPILSILGTKNKEENQNVQKKSTTPPILFGNSQKDASNIITPDTNQVVIVDEAEVKPKNSQIQNSSQSQSKPFFSGLFNQPPKPESTTVPFFGQTTSSSSLNLFGTNNQNTQSKPVLTPLFSQQTAKPEATAQATNSNIFGSNQTESKPALPSLFSQQPIKPETTSSTANLNIFGNNKTESQPTLAPLFSQKAAKPEAAPKAPTFNLFGNNQSENKPTLLFSQPPIAAKSEVTNPPATGLNLFANNKNEGKPALAPLFSQAPTTTVKSEVTSTTNSNLFSGNQSEGLFQKKPLFQASEAIPINNASNPQASLFQNNITFKQTIKTEQPTKTVQNQAQNVPPAKTQEKAEVNQEIFRKQSQKNDKKQKSSTMFTAIGPGGKKIEMQPIFQTDKPNLFASINETGNLFKQPPSSNNLFQTPTNNIFQQSSSTPNIFQASSDKPLFNSNPSTTSTGGLFSQNSSNLFGNNAGNNLFSSNTSKPQLGSQGGLFSKDNIGQVNEEEEGDDDDDGPIEAYDDANPNLSTGKYDYIQTQVFFKENANKFRDGTKETLENTVISIEKFEGSDDRYLYVRMPNKCIAFCGKFLKNITENRVLNTAKNISIKKILVCGENATKPELTFTKISFKEDSIGQKFMKEAEIASGKAT